MSNSQNIGQDIRKHSGDFVLNEDNEMVKECKTFEALSSEKEDCKVPSNDKDEDTGHVPSNDKDEDTGQLYPDDYSRYFIPGEDEEFYSKEDVKAWCISKGRQHNCSIVAGPGTKTGKPECNGKGSRIELVCSRSGVYKSHKAKDYVPKKTNALKRKRSSTTKINCPFKLICSCDYDGRWNIKIKCGFHNHALTDSLVGHSVPSALTEKQLGLLKSLTESLIPPRKVLSMIKQDDPDTAVHLRSIYNAKAKLKKQETQGMTVLQHFLALAEKDDYTIFKRCDGQGVVIDLFIAHPRFVDLARCFHQFVIVDCTYKTNRYDKPLFHMVSHTSTNAPFTVGFCLMSGEAEDNFVWALECLKGIYRDNEWPSVLLTDADQALMKAIRRVFPVASHLLCTWHIDCKVIGNCKPIIIPPEIITSTISDNKIGVKLTLEEKKKKAEKEKKEEEIRNALWESFFEEWKQLVRSVSVAEFNKKYANFIRAWSPNYGKAVSYCNKQWLDKHKEKFVAAWTCRVKHYNNQATSTVESSHKRLKGELLTTQGNLVTIWKAIHSMFEGDRTRIERDFQESLIRSRSHYFNYPFLKSILYNVSWHAIDQMLEDMRFGSNIGWEDGRCICKVTTTMGLPCSHIIRNFERAGKVIPIDAVDPFWRCLTFKPPPREEGKQSLQEMNIFLDVQHKWEKASESGKQVIEASLKEIIYPHTSTKSEPKVNETPKGRPTKKKKETTRLPSLHERIGRLYPPVKMAPILREKEAHQDHHIIVPGYLKDMPDHFIPYILSTKDVAKDGNCGFHVVVEALGLNGSLEVGELDPISYVRDKMVTNLLKNESMYKKMMTDEEFVELVNRIRPISEDEYLVLPGNKRIVPFNRWMIMPKCGFVIAETFSCAVYYINRDMSYTFVPTLARLRNGVKNRKVIMGFVEGNHFIGLHLKENCPLPPRTDSLWFWKNIKSDFSTEWYGQIDHRMKMWNNRGKGRLLPSGSATGKP